jgi:NAD(P)-dependent dehydrogenase (short-subunit alcohol dehydrogenase family)
MSKTVLITGSSSGIGAASVKVFQEAGWRVVATMRHPEKSPLFENMENVLKTSLDVTNSASINDAVSLALDWFGPIDVLVNNAGYGMVGAFEASNETQVERQFSTNVLGLMNVTRAILPGMREHGGGTIINLSSIGGQLTFPLYSVYHATKFAVEGFSESLQYELAEFGIKVKLIQPGPIKTDFYQRSQDLTSKAGLHAYDSFIERTLPNMQESGATAPGPELVAKTIYRAACDPSKRLRYPVNSASMLALRKLVPDMVAFAIVKMRLIK